jgi:(1->4)-alpha-D-glucan 1-alpha-D-glucosylmutase
MNQTTRPHPTQLLRIPVSTYRLQLNAGLTFAQAADVAAYLHRLGITDLYVSPSFKAAPGSPHGYDICDHTLLNPELGGDEGFAILAAALRKLDMGLVLDFVPNHMGADPAANPWWRDVLENGPSSPYARFFDIDWRPLKTELFDKVLLPVLGDQYGRVLERGELRVRFDSGAFTLAYFEHCLPLNPRQMAPILSRDLDVLKAELPNEAPHLREFQSVLTALRNLPSYTETDAARIEERHREKEIARERLARLAGACETVRAYIERVVNRLNGVPGQPATFNLLHDLLEAQAYRLAYWRTAQHEINYRRFFDINGLIGVRVEDPAVFREVHQGVLRLVRDGAVTGLRLDHIDGLLDPKTYLQRLDEALRESRGKSLYVVAEKILSAGEVLATDFRLEGTSGYDFLNDVNGLFVDGKGARPLKHLHARFTGRTITFSDLVYQAKSLIADSSLASELAVLAHALNRLSEKDRRSRDFTSVSLQACLREVAACFPVYRTYLGSGGASGGETAVIETAIAQARRRNPAMESSVFDFLRGILLLRSQDPPSPELAAEQRAFALKLQQYTGPLQAKGLEDTAFYRHNVLVSLNEVGGDPQRFGVSVRAFHATNQHRRQHWPFTMLATSTHDTKRGEDARCRIDVLSEIPGEWGRKVASWSHLNASARTNIDGEPAPDRGDEYLFYQALLGAWPADQPAAIAPATLLDRMQSFMLKAIREAKLHTSWVNHNEAYERATQRFVDLVLDRKKGREFLASFVPFGLQTAFSGMLNSLSQLVLKLVSPGVPDFYQGCETWNLSLADPDNRRPVDFQALGNSLARMEPHLGDRTTTGRRRAFIAGLLESWQDGRIKHCLTAAGLHLRRRYSQVFLEGEYLPLVAEGAKAHHAVALARRLGDVTIVAVAPRLCRDLGSANGRPPLGARVWRDTRVWLPGEGGDEPFRDAFSGATLTPTKEDHRHSLYLADALAVLPVALLVRPWTPSA